MLYIFNSGYRPIYQENILSTLFLPFGWTNEYRYNSRNIQKDLLKTIKKLEGKEESIIIYIDRFAKDNSNNSIYKYYPVRKALFLSGKEESDQYYIRVQLLDYIYPNDLNSFNQTLIENTSSLLPMFKEDARNLNDGGYYIIVKEGAKFDTKAFMIGEFVWVKCVDSISSNAEYFKSSKDNQFVFARAKSIAGFPNGHEVHPRISNNSWFNRLLRWTKIRKKINDGISFYKVTINNSYYLHVNYIYPIQQTDTTSTAKLNFEASDSIEPQTDFEFPINARASRIYFPFIFNEPNLGSYSVIKYNFSPDSDKTKLTASRRSILFELSYSKRYWIGIIIVVLIFAITSFTIGIDLTKDTTFSEYIESPEGLIKIIAAVLQAFVLLVLSKLSSKKFL